MHIERIENALKVGNKRGKVEQALARLNLKTYPESSVDQYGVKYIY